LADMLQFVRELQGAAAGLTLEQYLTDRLRNLAVEKLFINLGEAALRLAESERSYISGVPWRQVIGLRNILAHGYEQVDHETLFKTIADDLASVETVLAAALLQRQ
jgi:uncharacterized protein with HEPN domain